MKVKFITLMFLTFTFISYSQTDDFICGTIEDDSPDPEGVYSYSIDPSTLNNAEPLVLKVFFWGINRDDGTSDNKLTEADALNAVASLNIKYNPFNIFFKYTGYNFIDSTRFYSIYLDENDPNNTDDSDYQSFLEFVGLHPNSEFYEPAINIYIPKFLVGAAGAYTSWNRIIINAGSFEDNTERTMNHEMGHNLSLKHAHRQWHVESEYCEHVTRDKEDTNDPNDPDDTYFNADVTGDKVVDTAAAPDFRNELCDELGYEQPFYEGCDAEKYFYVNEEYCTYYNEEGRDCQETLFEIEEEDVRNLMAYTYASCGLDLTTGQGIRARERIEYNNNDFFTYAITTVEELYEPYSGEYYVAGPQPTEHPPLFQPGFKYKFVECEGPYPAPAAYGTVFSYNINNVLLSIDDIETDYHSITHPNHSAILIKHDYSDFLDKPEKCYNNWNRKPSGGLITKFNDDVFNTNVTLTAQDSTSINNQNLIENLDSGLYKIEMNYDDGSKQETVIFKQNN